MTATFIKEDCYSAKVINCMVLGMAALSYRAYKKFVVKETLCVEPDAQYLMWISVTTGLLNFIG
jgi:hypothetical protein